MSTITLTSDERAAVTVLRGIARRTVADTLKMARALATIRAGHSLSETVTVAHSAGLTDVSRTRINVLVKAIEAAPADVTAAEFVTVWVKAQTDANREGAKAKRDAKAEAATGEGEGEGVPQGNDATRPATVKDGIRLLWELVSAFGYSPEFATALVAAAEFAIDDAKAAA